MSFVVGPKRPMLLGVHGLQSLCARQQMVKLKAFDKFENTTDALNAASHLVDSKLPKGLRKFLKAQCQGETLVIADSKLGKAISDKLVG
jgi:nucleolar protein 58